ncbi:MAG: polyprenyl synthetase family protein [Armatimonadetes bacterium]|nr:polyprenyl synthetase family protein [Armatimonadota bacterium]
MPIEQIYNSLNEELNHVERELKFQISLILKNKRNLKKIIDYFFKIPGKRLRPILVLLSAGLIKGDQIKNNKTLIELASAVELIHSASLIHDDIIDDSNFRRGQLTMNYQYKNKIAVLAGDMLYSHAFSLLIDKFDKRILTILSQSVERMCSGEIGQLKVPISSFEEYLKIIEDKTASFMSTCCQSAAILVDSDEKTVKTLGKFGFNFGISYQLLDDYLDNDATFNFNINLFEKAKEYGKRAQVTIASFENSKYKNSLYNLITYLFEKDKINNSKLMNVSVK